MSLVGRIGSFMLECGLAFGTAALVLGMLIPLMRHLGWKLGPSGNLVLILGTLLSLVAVATLRPGGSLRPPK